ncbi:ferredoxin [Halobacteriovorax sp. GB3]|uniref:ferredoxin n=1 Tax=Halobacteriovorax sp. GB3 TaxID=2719615 RepID=UPI00236061F8|nr:ferredoxin [Halobacteriovorax sp. GB3]MDD0852710.1 ferredoxin [Halobacteriovorax sp. GB3]
MNTTMIAMGVAVLAGVGLVVTLGVLSLLSGGLHFLFARPRVEILKSEKGETGFAFGFKWNAAREPAKFNRIKLRLFNPFGSPTQVEKTVEFSPKSTNFAEDFDMAEAMKQILECDRLDDALLEIEVMASKEGVTHYFSMKVRKFLEKVKSATQTAAEFNEANKVDNSKPVYTIPSRSFIADPLPASNKALKIATNPEFAGQFQSADASAAPQENFAVSKVWIEDGCIVCNACEGIFPEVFEVTDDTCLIRDGAPLDDGLKILEAAEACPTEVIKFNKVG